MDHGRRLARYDNGGGERRGPGTSDPSRGEDGGTWQRRARGDAVETRLQQARWHDNRSSRGGPGSRADRDYRRDGWREDNSWKADRRDGYPQNEVSRGHGDRYHRDTSARGGNGTWNGERRQQDRRFRDERERVPSDTRRAWKDRSRSRSRSRSTASADSEGHISSRITQITDRFRVERELDRGTFGAVFKAWDSKHKEYVAVKVVRRVERYVEDAQAEVDILKRLNSMRGSTQHCVQIFKNFHYQEHYCIVTELLGTSLYQSLKKLRGRDGRGGVSPRTLQSIARQLIEAMQFLSCGLLRVVSHVDAHVSAGRKQAGLVHADLKTENILLHAPDATLHDPDPRVKLIDFGAATWDTSSHGTIIQTRHYRAPEVVLGVGWSFPCDMWSIACIILELLEGVLTFDTHDTAQHLAMMERLCGPIPRHMARRADHGAEHLFDPRTDQLLWPKLSGGSPSRPRDRHAEDEVLRVRPLAERVGRDRALFELLDGMLRLDPKERATPTHALHTPYFESPQMT